VSCEDVREKLTVQCDFNLPCRPARFGICGPGPERGEYIPVGGGGGRGVWEYAENGGRVLQGSAAASNGIPAEHQNSHQQKGDHPKVQVGHSTRSNRVRKWGIYIIDCPTQASYGWRFIHISAVAAGTKSYSGTSPVRQGT